jgi:hypothetical protein
MQPQLLGSGSLSQGSIRKILTPNDIVNMDNLEGYSLGQGKGINKARQN